MKNKITIFNKQKDKISGKMKNKSNKDVPQWKGVGDGVRMGEGVRVGVGKRYILCQNLRVSFIYCIVNN